MDILKKIKNGRVYFDGGYGTMLQQYGLAAGELTEVWNITHADTVTNLHYDYLAAGSDIISANTFGANSIKYSGDGDFSLEKVIAAAIQNARSAIARLGDGSERFVALDIGPTGRLLKPFGDLDFEEAVEIFAQTVRLGVKYGADLILIETMNDSYETKAAVLAAKENSNLPIFVTNAYDESGKLVTGATPAAMVAMLEGLGVDALGINCSLGPQKMLPVVEEILRCSSTPVIVNPNAGMPSLVDGRTVFECGTAEFAETMTQIAQKGATILGGCCGTTPEHIREMRRATENISFSLPSYKDRTVISSYAQCVEFGRRPVIIGERINPTGKSAFKQALRDNNMAYILNEGVTQQDAGAEVLDVNVGLPEIDEADFLLRAVRELQAVTSLPLQIDTSNKCAMEQAVRAYNGKPLINSVDGKQSSMDAVFPIAKKYGGAIIALTLDENGIPDDADGRVAIAEKIIDEAKKYGIDRCDIIVDPLAMTVSTDTASAGVTLECIKRLSAAGINTSLGVSNISYGLPSRMIVNSTFFTMAMNCGLKAAIVNPRSREMMDAYHAYCVLAGLDGNCMDYIKYATEHEPSADIKPTEVSADNGTALHQAIVRGLREVASASAGALLTDTQPLEVINNFIIPALDEIGIAFEQKKAFLPQLLMSAEAAQSAFDKVKESFLTSGTARESKFKIVLATVKGDIHDIGKNIVKVLLENYDYEVIDLGKDVDPEIIVSTAESESAPLVGLSGLMTTSLESMENTIKLLRERVPNCRVVVGGAVLTQKYADMIGADKCAKDAMETVRYAEQLHSSHI